MYLQELEQTPQESPQISQILSHKNMLLKIEFAWQEHRSWPTQPSPTVSLCLDIRPEDHWKEQPILKSVWGLLLKGITAVRKSSDEKAGHRTGT